MLFYVEVEEPLGLLLLSINKTLKTKLCFFVYTSSSSENKTTKLRKLQLNWESEMESTWLVLPLYSLFEIYIFYFTFAFHFKAIPPSFFLLPIFLFLALLLLWFFFKRCHPPFSRSFFLSSLSIEIYAIQQQ